MRCGGVAAAYVVVVVASAAVSASFTLHRKLFLAPPPIASALSSAEHHGHANRIEIAAPGSKEHNPAEGGLRGRPRQDGANIAGLPDREDLNLTPAQILALKKLLLLTEEGLPNTTVYTAGSGRSASEEVRWQCLLEWLRAQSYKSKKDQRSCSKEEGEQKTIVKGNNAKDCTPVLLLVVPALCNGTQSCVNLTETSIEELLHRYVLWERKKKRQEEANDAVIYIVVVLAFYSFGIVFMIANFVRQEQRELEETKMYKQYVKLARDRWLTTRGNMANKLALQALNTFNAIPQTTDVNKVTFV